MRKAMIVLFMSLFMGMTVYGSEVDGYTLLVNSLNNIDTSEIKKEVELESADSLVNQGLQILEKIQKDLAIDNDYKQLNIILIELKKVHDSQMISREVLMTSEDSNSNSQTCYNCGLHTYVAQYGMDAYCNYRIYYICEECTK